MPRLKKITTIAGPFEIQETDLDGRDEFGITDDLFRILNKSGTKIFSLDKIGGIVGSLSGLSVSGVVRSINVKDYGAAGDGITDDISALNAAVAACPVGGIISFEPGKTYLISTTWIINKKITIDLGGTTIKKKSTLLASAISFTAADVVLKNGTVDCNQAGGATTNGVVSQASGGICINVISKNTKGGSLFSVAGASTELTCFACIADTSLENAASGGQGFYATSGGLLRTDASCRALNCQQNGWQFDSSAADRCILNGYAYKCGGASVGSAGAKINSDRGSSDWFLAEDCKNYGVWCDTSSSLWDFGNIHTVDIGLTDANPSATAFHLQGAIDITFGKLSAFNTPGYGISVTAGSIVRGGVVEINTAGDPGVHVSGSSHLELDSAFLTSCSYGVVIGEGLSPKLNEFTCGLISARDCHWCVLRVDAGTVSVDYVRSRNCYTTDAGFPGLLDFSTADTFDCVVRFLDHDTLSGTKPTNLVHFDANCLRNLVTYGVGRGDFSSAAVSGAGVNGNAVHPSISQITFPSLGQELDYVQITANATTTQTVEATATTLLTSSAITYDGSTTIILILHASIFGISTPASFILNLWEDGTDLGRITQTPALTQVVPCHAELRRTPSAGSHTYTVRGWVTAGTGTLYATSPQVPAFLRIVRAS